MDWKSKFHSTTPYKEYSMSGPSHPWLDRTAEIKKGAQSVSIQQIEKLIDLLAVALKNGDSIYVAGNGGSACSASHIVEDLLTDVLAKNSVQSLSNILCLNDNSGSITGLANDCGFEQVFSQQIRRMAITDDIVILLSGSGNSPNIIEAAYTAKRIGCTVIGFTGFDGGKLLDLADIYIHVQSSDMGLIQDVHLIVYHYIHKQLQLLFK